MMNLFEGGALLHVDGATYVDLSKYHPHRLSGLLIQGGGPGGPDRVLKVTAADDLAGTNATPVLFRKAHQNTAANDGTVLHYDLNVEADEYQFAAVDGQGGASVGGAYSIDINGEFLEGKTHLLLECTNLQGSDVLALSIDESRYA